MSYILNFRDKSEKQFLTGAKAINLAKLTRAGLNIPMGIALTFEAAAQHLASNGLDHEVQALLKTINNSEPTDLGNNAAKIRALIENAPMPQDLVDQVESSLQFLSSSVSVRSSSNLEDRSNFSFAGQHDSYLNMRGLSEVADAIKKVWASAYSDRAMVYLRTLNMPVQQIRMGVVIQDMVNADSAGVMFSLHPVTGDRNQLYISAAWGLGESTVSGLVTPDEILVDRDTSGIVSYQIGAKEERVVPDDAGGTRTERLDQSNRDQKVLSAEQIDQLKEAMISIEEIMAGDPQDVEWAFANEQLSLLQARPMVVLEGNTGISWNSPIPKASWRRNWRLGEWLPDAVTPLFSSWVLPGLVASREEFGTQTLGWEDMTSFSMPHPWFCLVHGYFFTRTDFPPFNVDVSKKERFAKMIQTGERVSRWHTQSLPAYIEHFKSHLGFDLKAASSDSLVEFVQQLVSEAGEFWSFIAPIGYGFEEMLFKTFYNETIEDENKPHHSILFSGFTSRMHDAQVALFQLHEKIKAEHATEQVLAINLDEKGVQSLPIWLQQDISKYDAEYGHQVVSLDIYFKTLGETPVYTLRALQSLLRTDAVDPAVKLREVQSKRKQSVESVLSGLKGTKQQVMAGMIKYYQGNAAVREDANFYLQIGWPLIRRAIKELGFRLVQANCIDNVDEIFFLEADELQGLAVLLDQELMDQEPSAKEPLTKEPLAKELPDLKQIAQSRFETWSKQRELNPPIVISDKPVDQKQHAAWDAETGLMQAIGASPGMSSGKVRIVISADDSNDFVKGEVLVIKAASPLFMPMMLLASALIVEVGGGASHSSLVARELGLPAVVNATNATEIFSNGQLVQVNGETGEVLLIAQS